MKKTLPIISFLVISFIGLMVLPWYSIAVFAALLSFIGKHSFWSAAGWFFISGFLLWMIYAYYLDQEAASRLSSKIAVLFGNQKVITLMIITGLMGGITSALGAISGSLMNNYFNSK